ncbi:hypothetical protein WJX73_001926 [Symbiochloris irregularis]|uniref:Uncharacterized protein n=1 Tax=Symbiochloris irregularis TaxID=706552 RepID=A0AAW1P2V1_9CHLO
MAGRHALAGPRELQGTILLSPQYRSHRTASRSTRCMVTKREDLYDKDWKKGYFGTGYFVEGTRPTKEQYSYLRQLEKKKVLSGVEKAGLLSKLERAGLTLSKIEDWKLLSTAESLGALSLLERALETEPGTIASLSIPPLIASIAILTLVPDDNPALAAVKYSAAAVLLGSTGAFIAGAFLLSSLSDE